MAFALISLFPKHRKTAVISVLYALYIGIGVSFSVHWLSEFIAGDIIGTVIGLVVGASYSGEDVVTLGLLVRSSHVVRHSVHPLFSCQPH